MSEFPGGFDPSMFANVPLFRELARLLSAPGAVNWELASQIAMAQAAPAGDDAVPSGATAALRDAVDVVERWLDDATALPAVVGDARALGRAEWVRMATRADGLGRYVEPVAEGMGAALGSGLGSALGELGGDATAGLGGLVGDPAMLAGVLRPVGALMYGVSAGTVAGHLASQLLGTYDLGLPTVDPHLVGTVGDALDRLASDYELDLTEARWWLALRECASRRLYAGVPWLAPHLAGLIRRFASEADTDPESLLRGLGGMGLDPMAALSDPQALQRALEGPEGFRVEPTPAQRRTLDELQALVAFTDGWVETVVAAAAGGRLPSLGRIGEVVRRRRAEAGPGERFLAQLVGLDLRPADLRQGREFCSAVVAARGQEGLDRAWAGADRLPSPADLAEPSRWLVRLAALELEPETDA